MLFVVRDLNTRNQSLPPETRIFHVVGNTDVNKRIKMTYITEGVDRHENHFSSSDLNDHTRSRDDQNQVEDCFVG